MGASNSNSKSANIASESNSTNVKNKKIKRNKEKLKDLLKDLKSRYILDKIFNNLIKTKSLGIIKYNKRVQKRMNISINNYKEYFETLSPIELEIIPGDDKYGKFINIKEEEEKYCHVYFNKNKKDIKRFNITRYDKVKKIKIIIDYQIKSFEDLFNKCDCIESICFKKFNRNNIDNMNSMFSDCLSLKKLDLSNFNTKNVTNMAFMFSECSSLEELNFSKFSTYNVTDMSYMFSGCSSLEELNLSNFTTFNVIDMSFMFSGCMSLQELNISNFNFQNVRNMRHMFDGCPYELKNTISNKYKGIGREALD